MGVMDVCAEGLHVLAGQCTSHAAGLASHVPVAVAGPSAQVTAAAVAGAYTTLGETAIVLVGRLTSTGEVLTTSAAEFAIMDRTSAAALSALGRLQVQMPGLGGGGVPSLSQILGWDVEHLTRAATDWVGVAGHWEEAFDSVHRGAMSPGGTVWEGEAANAAQERTFADLVKVRGMSDRLQEAAEIARRGADQLSYLKRQAVDAIDAARAAGFAVGEDLSVTETSRLGSLRLAELRHHAASIGIRAAALSAADKEIATRITTVTAALSGHGFIEPPGDRTVQAVDFRQAPPPDPAYPVNDVIAEATDLDGNHIVLRRGYFDGKKGFGWDKIFHKHGITNPNVFKDLISHSRPISNMNGELIYKVVVNRAHCESKLGGLYTSCADTGESLEMNIVVDIAQNRWDVPDGGQKGVITMYPEPGGSGVVEVAPKWTMAPPWVSNNVPIN